MLAVDVDIQALVQAARRDDPDAWDRLLHRYQLPLFAYVSELVRPEQSSLDIVQETFINAARHLDTLRDDDRFGSWLFGIAHQKCVQHWRRQGRENRFLDADAPPPDETPASTGDPGQWLIRKEREEEFLAALDRLPAAHRSVLLLHFLKEFPLEEIAAITAVPVGTVKSRLHYAKKMLRELLEDRT
jgi:RNA polymerase sigma-70 factor, ECF subfamily